jgi:hypothetical protein
VSEWGYGHHTGVSVGARSSHRGQCGVTVITQASVWGHGHHTGVSVGLRSSHRGQCGGTVITQGSVWGHGHHTGVRERVGQRRATWSPYAISIRFGRAAGETNIYMYTSTIVSECG